VKWSIPDRMIQQGREYVNESRVLSIQPDFQNQVWHSEVLGSRMYHVTLDGTAREQDVCQCKYWKTHQYCKHTIAVELFLKEKCGTRILTEQSAEHFQVDSDIAGQEFVSDLTQIFYHENRGSKSITTRPEFSVHYTLQVLRIKPNAYMHGECVLALSLRAGLDKLYMVTNIEQFTEQFVKQEKWEYRTADEIDFKEVQIKESDQQILYRLYKMMEEQTGVLNKQLINVTARKIDSYLILPPSSAKSVLMELLKTERVEWSGSDETYDTALFTSEKPPYKFLLEIKGDGIEVHMDRSSIVPLLDYDWLIEGNNIFELSIQQQKLLDYIAFFNKRFDGQESVYIDEADVSDLLTYVTPLLKQIGSVNYSEELAEQMIDEPLTVAIHFYGTQKRIKGDIIFQYGDTAFQPSVGLEDGSRYLIRDTVGEEKILQVLEQLNFTIIENQLLLNATKDVDLFSFLYRKIPALRLYADVQLSPELQKLVVENATISAKVQRTARDSFLDIRFDVEGISENEVDRLLNSIKKNELYFKTEDGRLLSLETEPMKEMNHFLSLIREDSKMNNGTISMPMVKSFTLEQEIQKLNPEVYSQNFFKDLFQYIKNPESFPAELPKSLHADLRPYQVTGFKWLKFLAKYGLGGILADEMGLGKTLQLITFLLSEIEEGHNGDKPSLIIAPASLIYNWKYEFQKFAPDLQTCVISGMKKEREFQLANLPKDGIAITSYQSFRQDVELYQAVDFHTMVLDESQYVNNYHTKTFRAITKMAAKVNIALSGTPIENSVTEFWAIYQLVLPGLFPKVQEFKKLTLEQISKTAKPFMLRRLKADVLSDLPEKTESDIYSSLNRDQKVVYLAYLQQLQDAVAYYDNEDFQKNRMEILSGLTRLRQICCDPRLIDPAYQGGSGKLEQLIELLRNAKENRQHVLVFSQFTSMLKLIEDELAKEGISNFYLSGKTPPSERIELVNQFNDGQADVFLISLKAGGTGLNLTGADTVILFDLWWNPAVEEQAAGRAHRIGQKKNVQVYRFIAEGTIEEKINQLQQDKKMLFDQLIISEGEEALSRQRLSNDDIKQILGITS
jgi:SNF2 family DNA or RNA helicase